MKSKNYDTSLETKSEVRFDKISLSEYSSSSLLIVDCDKESAKKILLFITKLQNNENKLSCKYGLALEKLDNGEYQIETPGGNIVPIHSIQSFLDAVMEANDEIEAMEAEELTDEDKAWNALEEAGYAKMKGY